MEKSNKRKIISALLMIAVAASFILLAVECNSGGYHILTGIAGWIIEMAALSVLTYNHIKS